MLENQEVSFQYICNRKLRVQKNVTSREMKKDGDRFNVIPKKDGILYEKNLQKEPKNATTFISSSTKAEVDYIETGANTSFKIGCHKLDIYG